MYKAQIIEIFIPEVNSENKKTNILSNDLIGFKVNINNNIVNIIEKQNKINCNIYPNDFIIVEEINNNLKIMKKMGN